MTNENETEIQIDDTSKIIDTPVYEFTLATQTHPNYKICNSIIEWIKNNLEQSKDDNQQSIFSKVNYGYNSDTLKGFGKKPVADVYIDRIEYNTDFDDNRPDIVHTFIIAYLKGNMNNAYVKACELTDFLLQEFEENTSFRELTSVVRNTSVANVEIQIIPSPKTYGVLCAFELEHKLY